MRAFANLLLLFAIGLIFPFTRPAMAQTQEEILSRGRYIFTSVQGCACHIPRNPDGSYNTNLYLAGAPSNPPPVGHPATVGWTTRAWKKVYARNITPDPETGIGKWSEEQFLRAFKERTRSDGTKYDNSDMPWDSYKNMKEEDIRAIYKYLRTIKPISNKVPANIPPQ